MKISILLPYKENFSPTYPGAVSIFLNSTIKLSKYKKEITVFGSTKYKTKYNIRYKNIDISEKTLGLGSQTNKYINKFINLENKIKSDIIEVHNRPFYVQLLPNNNTKKILYFHNDPLTMNGSKSVAEREDLLRRCSSIIFNSYWSKKRFLSKLNKIFTKSEKLIIIHQSTDRQKVNINKKKKYNYFRW